MRQATRPNRHHPVDAEPLLPNSLCLRVEATPHLWSSANPTRGLIARVSGARRVDRRDCAEAPVPAAAPARRAGWAMLPSSGRPNPAAAARAPMIRGVGRGVFAALSAFRHDYAAPSPILGHPADLTSSYGPGHGAGIRLRAWSTPRKRGAHAVVSQGRCPHCRPGRRLARVAAAGCLRNSAKLPLIDRNLPVGAGPSRKGQVPLGSWAARDA